jgi:hypothetical protein
MYTKRVEDGNPTKFSKDDKEYPLSAFAADALEHMKTHGMDTVFYMKGVSANAPAGSEEGALELFTYHAKYTKSTMAEHIKRRCDPTKPAAFDSYAIKALQDSGKWLKNSLDQTLKTSLKSVLSTNPSGPVLWMHIVAKVQSDSLRRCQVIQNKFKEMKLSDFPGEDVEEYCTQATEYLDQLAKEDQLPKDHLLHLVDVFTACSVLDFQVHWMGRRTAVENFQKEIAGKDPSVLSTMSNPITYTLLLEEAGEKFMNLKHLWGPAKDAKGAHTASAETLLLQKIERMEAKLSQMSNRPRTFPGKSCYGCGMADMIKPQCPRCKNSSSGGSNGGSRGGSNGGGRSRGNPAPAPASSAGGNDGSHGNSSSGSKWAAPKDGEPHTKTINGKTMKWCAKCRDGKGRWTKTHHTNGHTDHSNKGSNGNGNGSSPHGQAQGSVAQLDLSTIDVNALNAAQQQALAAFLKLT